MEAMEEIEGGAEGTGLQAEETTNEKAFRAGRPWSFQRSEDQGSREQAQTRARWPVSAERWGWRPSSFWKKRNVGKYKERQNDLRHPTFTHLKLFLSWNIHTVRCIKGT